MKNRVKEAMEEVLSELELTVKVMESIKYKGSSLIKEISNATYNVITIGNSGMLKLIISIDIRK